MSLMNELEINFDKTSLCESTLSCISVRKWVWGKVGKVTSVT